MSQDQGASARADRATRASPEPASGLGQKASVPCARQLMLTAEVRDLYPLDPDFGPHTTRLRGKLHLLCDIADELYDTLAQARQVLATYQPDSAPTFYMEALWAAETALANARGDA